MRRPRPRRFGVEADSAAHGRCPGRYVGARTFGGGVGISARLPKAITALFWHNGRRLRHPGRERKTAVWWKVGSLAVITLALRFPCESSEKSAPASVSGFKTRVLGSLGRRRHGMPERSNVLSTGTAVVRDACVREETQGKRNGKGHQRFGGNAGIAVNLQRIGAIACQSPLARVG